jgi:hypothetical protein
MSGLKRTERTKERTAPQQRSRPQHKNREGLTTRSLLSLFYRFLTYLTWMGAALFGRWKFLAVLAILAVSHVTLNLDFSTP